MYAVNQARFRGVTQRAISSTSVIVFIDPTAALRYLSCKLRSTFFVSTLLTMGHQTTDAYNIWGSKIVLYIHMAILSLILQDLPMALLYPHIQE
jgi:hypothetical protein